jgi:hypothetical protein
LESQGSTFFLEAQGSTFFLEAQGNHVFLQMAIIAFTSAITVGGGSFIGMMNR